MDLKWKRESLWAVAIIVRTLPAIAFPSVAELLAGRVEVSTPVNSFKRCELQPGRLTIQLTLFYSTRRPLPLRKRGFTLRWRCLLSGTLCSLPAPDSSSCLPSLGASFATAVLFLRNVSRNQASDCRGFLYPTGHPQRRSFNLNSGDGPSCADTLF